MYLRYIFVKHVSRRYNIRMNKLKTALLLERIGNLLRSEERADGAAAGLQSVHVQILTYLSRCNRYSNTPAGVTEYLGTTKGTVSQSINILEERGFIEKRADENDGRVVRLLLTTEGRSFVEGSQPPSEFSGALDSFDPAELDSLSSMLTKFLTALQRRNKRKMFGVCHTCRHFRENGLGDKHQCGLTLEPLSEDDSLKICREHEAPESIVA